MAPYLLSLHFSILCFLALPLINCLCLIFYWYSYILRTHFQFAPFQVILVLFMKTLFSYLLEEFLIKFWRSFSYNSTSYNHVLFVYITIFHAFFILKCLAIFCHAHMYEWTLKKEDWNLEMYVRFVRYGHHFNVSKYANFLVTPILILLWLFFPYNSMLCLPQVFSGKRRGR